jgi:hypothetical protein
MSFDSPKLNDLLDQGFINMHEQFLEGEKQLSDWNYILTSVKKNIELYKCISKS